MKALQQGSKQEKPKQEVERKGSPPLKKEEKKEEDTADTNESETVATTEEGSSKPNRPASKTKKDPTSPRPTTWSGMVVVHSGLTCQTKLLNLRS
jgi:hypothetical protein